jgi:hypothetical protein
MEGKTGNEKKMTSALDYILYILYIAVHMYWRTSWTRSINKTGQIEKYLKYRILEGAVVTVWVWLKVLLKIEKD